MELKAVSDKYVILTSSSNEQLDENIIIDFVKKILKRKSIPSWDMISVDTFCCKRQNLYIVYPRESMNIRFATYAFPYISEYFTD